MKRRSIGYSDPIESTGGEVVADQSLRLALRGDLAPILDDAQWEVVAFCGRSQEIGKHELLGAGKVYAWNIAETEHVWIALCYREGEAQ